LSELDEFIEVFMINFFPVLPPIRNVKQYFKLYTVIGFSNYRFVTRQNCWLWHWFTWPTNYPL